MKREELRACLPKPGAEATFPFGDAAVFKVIDKMFALVPVKGSISINLKCEPTSNLDTCEGQITHPT